MNTLHATQYAVKIIIRERRRRERRILGCYVDALRKNWLTLRFWGQCASMQAVQKVVHSEAPKSIKF